MATPADSLICPITLELFRNPVLAQDGHTYEREAIENWIRTNGTSPLTRQQLSLEHLYPNIIVKQLVAAFEKSLQQKNYQFILDVDVRKKKGRPLFQTYGKTIYHAEWLPADPNQPEIILLKIDGARALKEASFYVNLARHPHVVRTFGFVLDKNNDNENNSIMLMQEYASEGSLNELVRERSTPLDEKILIEMFLQIIDAMIFLAYNHVVHGDLACRNVLIFRFDETNPKNNIVKVTDFGLSRQSALYSKTLGSAHTTLDIIPTRYAAPEILAEGSKLDNYTEKSDVYSMGVLMWEAYSRGALPWSKIEKDAELIRNVMNSVYLPQPSNCSSKYWNIIIKTWSKLSRDRPTFEQLKCLLIEQSYLSGIRFSFFPRLVHEISGIYQFRLCTTLKWPLFFG
jgi:serine/threonine protein kinase